VVGFLPVVIKCAWHRYSFIRQFLLYREKIGTDLFSRTTVPGFISKINLSHFSCTFFMHSAHRQQVRL